MEVVSVQHTTHESVNVMGMVGIEAPQVAASIVYCSKLA